MKFFVNKKKIKQHYKYFVNRYEFQFQNWLVEESINNLCESLGTYEPPTIRLNIHLPMIKQEYKGENRIISKVCETILHEFLHFLLFECDVDREFQHYIVFDITYAMFPKTKYECYVKEYNLKKW